MAERQIYAHTNHNLTEIRRVAIEQLTALPATPEVAGRIVQVGNTLYYGLNAATWQSLQAAIDPLRFVGGLDVSTGSVPLVTPLADPAGGNAWQAGDYGIVTVAGTLAPAPNSGNVDVEVGDMLVCISAPAAGNGNFAVIERNPIPATGVPVGENISFGPADWYPTGNPNEWEVKLGLAVIKLPYSAQAVNVTSATQPLFIDNFATKFDVGVVFLQAHGPAAPADKYECRVLGTN